MTTDDTLQIMKQSSDDLFPFFIKKDYCEDDWVKFYQFLKNAKIATFAHDGGFYFRNEDDYMIALLLK